MKSIILCDSIPSVQRVYQTEETIYTYKDLPDHDFTDIEAVFSTWGMPKLTEEEIGKYFPRLQYVFYAAGSVQYFARPFLNKGVRVFSAWQANAVPVIQFAVAEILLANKGFYALSRQCSEDYWKAAGQIGCYGGNYKATVGILGYGAIGSQVVAALRKMNFTIYVYAPNFTHDDEIKTGAIKAELAEIFVKCPVVSNHMANLSSNKQIIDEKCFSAAPKYGTFINTGRGAQVSEQALIKRLTADPTYTAVLDVTDPEPPLPGSPLYTLPNVVLTPHLAGSSGLEVTRMAEYMREEAARIEGNIPPKYEITKEMLETMA